MKATGIVRRIEEYGIIRQKLSEGRINTWFSVAFDWAQFAQNLIKINYRWHSIKSLVHFVTGLNNV